MPQDANAMPASLVGDENTDEDKTYYAWSEFVLKRDEFGVVRKRISPGDVVTEKILNCTPEQWAAFIRDGSVRPRVFPATLGGISPVEYFRQQAAALAEVAV